METQPSSSAVGTQSDLLPETLAVFHCDFARAPALKREAESVKDGHSEGRRPAVLVPLGLRPPDQPSDVLVFSKP